MCGITGIISKGEIDLNELKEMTDSIAHRGPDDSGYFIHKMDSFFVGLGHRRLSIIDLDVRSKQPFYNSNNDIALIYNGEIYNYIELKKDLEDYKFKTSSDTEVILALYETLGINFVSKLTGIFAFAIVDFKLKKTYLVRDRHGVKPLYFYLCSEHLVFSSELRPIMKFPYFKKKIKSLSLELMLSMQYIPSNLSIFENVYKVNPGTIMIFQDVELIEEIIYWDLIDEYYEKVKTNPESSFYEKELNNAIQRNLVSDVEVVTYLSGGIDSSLVTSIASEYSTKLKSYTIGFDSPEYDESLYAKEISKTLNIENETSVMTIDNLANVAIKIAKIFDEPFADVSLLPTYFLSKMVKEDGKKVVLSGDGGDEFFYGYIHYTKMNFRQSLFNTISPIFKVLKPIFCLLGFNFFSHLGTLLTDTKLFYYIMITGRKSYYARKVLIGNPSYDEIKNVFGFLDRIKDLSPIETSAIFDQKIYLVDDILVKLDRASMSNSLESRVPLLDHQLTLAAYQSETGNHFEVGVGKKILKKILNNYTNERFISREKQGFNVPLLDLLMHPLIMTKIEYFVSYSFLNSQNLFEQEEINKLFYRFKKNQTSRLAIFLWNFFVFQSWYEEYILE